MRRWILVLIALLFAVGTFLLVRYWSEWFRYVLIPVLATLAAGLIKETVAPFIRDILVGVIGGKIEKRTPDSLADFRDLGLNLFSSAERREIENHLNKQVESIRRMPFVFKDLTEIEDLLDNVIEPEAPRIDLRTLRPRSPSQKFQNVLRDNKKMVLLGVAGVGKSTFQRHAVLKVIKDVEHVDFLKPEERVVPFYIQLRYVDTSVPFPILHHLLERTPYLKGSKGLGRLLKLASERKLFLFLDGYDEVPPSLGQKDNHLRDELQVLLTPAANRIRLPIPAELDEYREFYKHVQQRCRVWLSCRKDFFRDQSPFEQHESQRPDLAGLEIRGVSNRRQLIDNVFARYKPILERMDLFKAGAGLLTNLIERDSGELKTLSATPLLLIIICYVYAHEVIRTGDPKVQIANTLDTIIQQYLDLLLEKLDEGKDRNEELSTSEKAWLKEGRGLWIKEKQEFLKYFAAHLYIENKYPENKGAFSLQYVTAKVREFFIAVSDSPNRVSILQSLDGAPGTGSFTDQIKDSGIFSVAEAQGSVEGKEPLYDFPHQRFRELLGAQYFDTENHEYVTRNLKISALNGLLYVFFRITEHKDDVAKGLLSSMANNNLEAGDYLSFFINCLESAPSYKPQTAFDEFFLDCLRQNTTFEIPSELHARFKKGEYFEPVSNFTEQLTKHFNGATRLTLNAAKLSGELLFIYKNDLLRHVLKGYFDTFQGSLDSEIFQLRATIFRRLDADSAEECLGRAFERHLDYLNGPGLRLCAEILERWQPDLLEHLFAEPLSQAFRGHRFGETEERLFRQCMILRECNKRVFSKEFDKQLLACVRRNEPIELSARLLDIYDPSPTLKLDLLGAIEESIEGGASLSIALAAEIGFHYFSEGFDSKLADLLLPPLRKGDPSAERVILTSKQIRYRLQRLCREDDPLYELLDLAEFSNRLVPTSIEGKNEVARNPHCYILTDQVIKNIQQYALEHDQLIEKRDWRRISKLLYRAYSLDQLTKLLPTTLPPTITETILEFSKVSFSNYEKISRNSQYEEELLQPFDGKSSLTRLRSKQAFIR